MPWNLFYFYYFICNLSAPETCMFFFNTVSSLLLISFFHYCCANIAIFIDIKLPLLSNFLIFFALSWERASPSYSSTIRWNFFLDLSDVAKKVFYGRITEKFSFDKLWGTYSVWRVDSYTRIPLVSFICLGVW